MGLVGRKGKLSITESTADVRDIVWQRYEDVLTADVFGAYRYLPPRLGLLPALNHAVDETGKDFASFLRHFGVELYDLDVTKIRFWPTFEDGREPDVFVLLESTQHQQSVALLVEAKLHAPQHEIGERSQLGHYAIQHLSGAYAEGSIAWKLPQPPRPLLFITKHQEIPSAELTRARAEICREYGSLPKDEVGLFWINWGHIGEEAKRLWREYEKEVETAPWLRHLLDLYEEIRDRDLLPRPPFTGITRPALVSPDDMYFRSYSQQVPDSIGLADCASRHHFSSPSDMLPTGDGTYCRCYHTGQLRWNRAPALYSKEQRTNE